MSPEPDDFAVNTANNTDPEPLKKKVRGRPFEKGDARINRKGRPVKSADALKLLLQDIWSEIMFDGNGNPIIDDVTGKPLTRLQARLRIATSSRNTNEFRTALEYAYGKPKEELAVTADQKVIFEIIRETSPYTSTNPSPGSAGFSDEPGEAEGNSSG